MLVKLRAIGFSRISQVTDASTSIPRQNETIDRYCSAFDIDLVHIAESESVSGSVAPFEHESLREWLSDSPPEPWDVLVVKALDRVSRSVLDTLVLIKWLDERGKSLRTIDDNIDTSGGTSKIMILLLSALAEVERQKTVERTRDMRASLRRDGWHPAGRLPYARTKVQHQRGDGLGWKWGIDEEKAGPLREAIDYVIAGNTVVDTSREFDIPEYTLFRVLRSETLLGHQYHKGVVIHNFGDPVIFGPPIIDREKFDKLQTALNRLGRPHRQPRASTLLYGLVSCAECHEVMVGGGGETKRNYRCLTADCPNGSLLRRVVHAVLEEHLIHATWESIYIGDGHWVREGDSAKYAAELAELNARTERMMRDRAEGFYDTPELDRLFREQQTNAIARINELKTLLEEGEVMRFVPSGPPKQWWHVWMEAADDEPRRRDLLAAAGLRVEVTAVDAPRAQEHPDGRVIVHTGHLGSLAGMVLTPGEDRFTLDEWNSMLSA